MSFLFQSPFLIYMLSRILEEGNSSLIPVTIKKKKSRSMPISAILSNVKHITLLWTLLKQEGWDGGVCLNRRVLHAVALEKD